MNTKIKIFKAITETVGWRSLEGDINAFLEGKTLVDVTQSGGNRFVCISVFYEEKADNDIKPH